MRRAIEDAVAEVDGLDPKERRRLEYFSRQIVDMMSPTNFLATNPDALEKAVETEGQSLVDGLENLVADLERNDGELIVRWRTRMRSRWARTWRRRGRGRFPQPDVRIDPVPPDDRDGA